MNVYFDNSATTKICDEALARYIEVSSEHFGNPSSLHAVGHDAEKIMTESRNTILKTIGSTGELIFTASGTEANNLAILGRAFAKERYKGARIITSAGEHSSVNSPLAYLADKGYDIICIPTKNGVFDTEALISALTPKTILVSVMMVNNETGALYDIDKISRIVHTYAQDCVLHVDATQSYMKIPINVRKSKIDMLTISSHKIEGPKGVGALCVSEEIVKSKGLTAQILGGGQEHGYRSGTENVPGIAAFARAAQTAFPKIAERSEKMNELRDYIIKALEKTEAKPLITESHAPHIINVILPKIKSQTMLSRLSEKGICVSSGSACSSHAHHASSALAAYGISDEMSDYSIRISLSHRNTKEEANYFISEFNDALSTLQRVK